MTQPAHAAPEIVNAEVVEEKSPIRLKSLPKKMSLEELQLQISDKLGITPYVDLTVGGRDYRIHGMQVMPDDALERINASWQDRDLDVWPADTPPRKVAVTDKDGKMTGEVIEVPRAGKPNTETPTINGEPAPNPSARLARAILGEQYDQFKADGGESYMVAWVFNELNDLANAKEAAAKGESDPKSGQPSGS